MSAVPMTTPAAVRPPGSALSPSADRVLAGLLGAFGFVLPLSTAAVAIGMALLLAFSVTVAPQLWRTRPWRDPAVAAGLLLWAWIAVHTATSQGLGGSSAEAVNSYHELLLVPLMVALVRLCSRRWSFLCGLAAGSTVYAVAHWLMDLVGPLHTYLMPRYISAGYVMAVSAFVLLDQSRRGAPHARWMQAAALLLVSAVLFKTPGRTGLLVLALLAGYTAWCWAPRGWRLLGAGGLILLLLTVALSFGAARERMADVVATLDTSRASQQTSTGIRAGLLASSLKTAREHGLAGVGYAGFRQHHEEAARRVAAEKGQATTTLWVNADNPHNEYLMQLIGGGMVGLGLFVAWLLLPMKRRGAWALAPPSFVAVTLAFAVAAVFNSLLLDFVEAHFHAALLAWLLAQSPSGSTAAERS